MNLSTLTGDFLAIAGHIPDSSVPRVLEGLGYQLTLHTPGCQLWVRGVEYVTTAIADGSAAVVAGVVTAGQVSESLLRASNTNESMRTFNHELRTSWQGNWAGVAVSGQQVISITDHMGSVPIYQSSLNPSTTGAVYVVGTALQDVAAIAGKNSIDPVSAREFLAVGSITSPFTIRTGVQRQWPGTTVTFQVSHSTESVYWAPSFGDATSRLSEAAADANNAMKWNLASLARQFTERTVLLSGGEDARALTAILMSVQGDVGSGGTDAVIFLDGLNREFHLARSSAKLMGVPLKLVRRSFSHYLDRLDEMVYRTGGGFDLAHAHAVGLIEEGGSRLFVDGWTSDTFLKGIYLPASTPSIRGVPVGLARPSDEFRDASKAVTHLTEELAWRMEYKLARIREFRGDGDPPAWAKFWPVSDHEHFAFFSSNRALRRSAAPYMFGNFVDSIRGLRESQKLNRRLFHRIFRKSLGAAGWIPRTDGEIPRLSATLNIAPTALNRVVFRAYDRMRLKSNSSYSGGPWQNPTTILRAIHDEEIRIGEERLRGAFAAAGMAPSGLGIQQGLDLRLRALQLAVLIDKR